MAKKGKKKKPILTTEQKIEIAAIVVPVIMWLLDKILEKF